MKKLVETLKSNGTLAAQLTFPDRSTPIGNVIDSYLKGKSELGKSDPRDREIRYSVTNDVVVSDDAAIHLLFSANRWEKADDLRARLQRQFWPP